MPDDTKKMVDELTKQVDDLQKKLEAAGGAGEEAEALRKQLSETTEQLEKAAEQLEEANAEIELLKAKSSMTQDEKDYVDSMDETEEGQEKTKKFLEMSSDERAKIIKSWKSNDESVTIGGRVIQKSKVGDDVFAVMKAQAKEIADAQEAIAKANEERDMATFTKRAEDEFKHLPGTAVEKAQVLRAVAKLDEGVQKSLDAILKASEKALSAAFSKIGSSVGRPNPGGDAFMKRVEEVRKANPSMSRADAMQKARKDYPADFAAYNGTNGTAN